MTLYYLPLIHDVIDEVKNMKFVVERHSYWVQRPRKSSGINHNVGKVAIKNWSKICIALYTTYLELRNWI